MVASLNTQNTSVSDVTAVNKKITRYYEPSEQLKDQMHKSHDHLLPGDIFTKTKASLCKLGQSVTTYPAKGLKGDQNSNFYEFLAMGSIPYIVGSVAMITVFNGASKFFAPEGKKEASKIGKKLGVGVVLYVLAKELAKTIVDAPVHATTGVDLDQRYKKIIHELPENINEKGKTRIEYHKAFESVDFPRWDLFYTEGFEHGNRNEYFDKIAKRNGYGELQASDQEMKPKIKQLITKAQTWKTILAYTLAATAVGIAAQSPWEELFVNKGNKTQGFIKAIPHTLSMFKRSVKEMWKGGLNKSKPAGILGKTLLIASAVLSVIAPIATVSGFKAKHEERQAIDNSKRYYEA